MTLLYLQSCKSIASVVHGFFFDHSVVSSGFDNSLCSYHVKKVITILGFFVKSCTGRLVVVLKFGVLLFELCITTN